MKITNNGYDDCISAYRVAVHHIRSSCINGKGGRLIRGIARIVHVAGEFAEEKKLQWEKKK